MFTIISITMTSLEFDLSDSCGHMTMQAPMFLFILTVILYYGPKCLSVKIENLQNFIGTTHLQQFSDVKLGSNWGKLVGLLQESFTSSTSSVMFPGPWWAAVTPGRASWLAAHPHPPGGRLWPRRQLLRPPRRCRTKDSSSEQTSAPRRRVTRSRWPRPPCKKKKEKKQQYVARGWGEGGRRPEVAWGVGKPPLVFLEVVSEASRSRRRLEDSEEIQISQIALHWNFWKTKIFL